MNIPLFLTVFSALSLFYFYIGMHASKNITNNTDFFLASRDLGLFSVMFTLIATQLGGGMLLGTAQESYTIGVWGILYTLGMSIGFLMLGLGFAAKLRSLNVATTAELFQTKYHSPTLKKIASLFSIATMCGILIAQIIASRALLSGLSINNEILFLAFWAFVIVYTMVGGLKAVVITDVAQVWVIILIFGGIFLYSILNDPASFFLVTNITKIQDNFSMPGINSPSLIATIMLPALFSLIEQDLAQRFFAARTQRIATLAAIGSSLFLLLFSLIPIYFGMKARMLNIPLAPGANPLIPVIEVLTNEYVVIFALCGIIAAITSTADSLLCAISSNVAQDFDFSFLGIKSQLRTSQVVTFATGVTTLLASYVMPQNIIGLLISSYELSVSCLLVPLLYAYFSTNLKKNAAIGAIIGGLSGFILFRYFPVIIPKEIAAIATSLAGYYLGKMQNQK